MDNKDQTIHPKETDKTNHNVNPVKRIIIVLTAVITALVVIFAVGAFYFKSHFLPGTHIGACDVSGMTAETARTHMTEKAANNELVISVRGGDVITVTGSEIGLDINPEIDLPQILSDQSSGAWFLISEDRNYDIENAFTYDEDKFEEWYAGTGYFTNDNKTENELCEVHFNEDSGEYEAGGVQGDRLNLVETRELVSKAVVSLENTLDLESSGVYLDEIIPEATAEESEFAEKLNSYINYNITLDMGDNATEMVNAWVLSRCVTWDEDHNISIDGDALTEYVTELAATYDTVGTAREFMTHYGETIEAGGGSYGWYMNVSGTVEAIQEAIETENRDAVIDAETIYYRQGGTRDAVNGDIGSSYVELDIHNQLALCYIDGELKWISYCVTGDVSKNRTTPLGVYYIIYHQRDRILRGDRHPDGTYDYHTLVHYWMCWTTGGVGFHDSYWRKASEYGGSTYIRNGSHGCVNLPSEAAATLYDLTYDNMPVISYDADLSGAHTLTGIEITSSSGELYCEKGDSITCNAEVQGDAVNQDVVWSVSGQTSSGTTIGQLDGKLTVGEDERAAAVTVTCTSLQDMTTQGSEVVGIR